MNGRAQTRILAPCWSPLHSTVSTRLDPFAPDIPGSGELSDCLLYHCVHVLWPCARPVDFAQGSYHAYLLSGRKSIVMQAVFYSSSLHLDALSTFHGVENYRRHTAAQLFWKGQVLQQIRLELAQINDKTASDELTDDILLCILYLAANENLNSIPPPEQGPFNPPFKSQQLLEYYGNCQFHPLHWEAVEKIVLSRGGIRTVKLYGLGWLISLSALIGAVNSNTKPVFPLVYPDGKPYIYRAPLRALRVPEVSRYSALRNHGFQQLALLSPPIKGNLIRAFLDLGELTQGIEFLASRSCDPNTLTLVGNSRALIQHRLSNLPDSNDQSTAILHRRTDCTYAYCEKPRTIYLVCRTAAVLYSLNVAFPLPRTARQRATMSGEIQNLAMQLQGKQEDAVVELLLWCAMIAGICAHGDLREWFVRQAGDCICALGICSWDEMVVFLRSFAWLGCASDEAGKTFWDEVRMLMTSGP
ncbi:hypothetical protein P170DRAFT_355698 [Aspergillus steynii IBT 23096]|uniref:Uncharacterized protein n=1 Tax=Aspergillus steynii IBT 23096 TaxID=1392250 RepID=A0A2I2GCR2_9EURO|nr:uncharacterized protein P170DRAFT_355698 [Aspergillus steynii IBT 23096]PLB50660.1 hypothetical protein P170DRAFT_355698 [Aspergillus steynii IBT 23096]